MVRPRSISQQAKPDPAAEQADGADDAVQGCKAGAAADTAGF